MHHRPPTGAATARKPSPKRWPGLDPLPLYCLSLVVCAATSGLAAYVLCALDFFYGYVVDLPRMPFYSPGLASLPTGHAYINYIPFISSPAAFPSYAYARSGAGRMRDNTFSLHTISFIMQSLFFGRTRADDCMLSSVLNLAIFLAGFVRAIVSLFLRPRPRTTLWIMAVALLLWLALVAMDIIGTLALQGTNSACDNGRCDALQVWLYVLLVLSFTCG